MRNDASQATAPGPTPVTTPIAVVVMGVSGSGKSTLAAELVRRTGWFFAEADDFHPAANIAKMSAGQPLTDADRWPWLDSIATWIDDRQLEGCSAVLTCSALKRSYRDRLRAAHRAVWFAELAVPERELAHRMVTRTGHYMPVSLLASQLQTLEPLQPDEPGRVFDADRPVADVAADVLAALAVAHPKESV